MTSYCLRRLRQLMHRSRQPGEASDRLRIRQPGSPAQAAGALWAYTLPPCGCSGVNTQLAPSTHAQGVIFLSIFFTCPSCGMRVSGSRKQATASGSPAHLPRLRGPAGATSASALVCTTRLKVRCNASGWGGQSNG